MIKAEIVAHSVSPQGEELISVLATFPRIILAEVNTHRMLSKNTSSSRAIPFLKMVETIENNPFIPIAWQKDHKGMQGTEYFTDVKDVILRQSQWLNARTKAVVSAKALNESQVTKQLTNRLLEPFMWTTMLITGSKSGWDNFFRLRCPSYEYSAAIFKSRKDLTKTTVHAENFTNLDWLKMNKGQAEIHIMDLAEKIWDARNESTPKQLKAGEWHIPFEDKITRFSTLPLNETTSLSELETNILHNKIFISVAMGARTSYTTVGEEKEINPETLMGLHDRLLTWDPPHSSPFEHCARAMDNDEFTSFIRGDIYALNEKTPQEVYSPVLGWCYNLKGFIPYRYLVDNSLTL